MNPTCPKCNLICNPGTRFCPVCGTALAATMVQGRTVVLRTQTGPPPVPGFDVKTVIERARTSFGAVTVDHNPVTAAAHVPNQPEDTFLVEDHSGSMGEEFDSGITKLEAATRSSVNLVANKYQIDPNDRIGLTIFDDGAELLCELSPLSSHKREIIQAIQSVRVGGGTDIDSGMKKAEKHFDWTRQGTVRRVVLLTDGLGGDPRRTAARLKSRGVVIDVIGIGPEPGEVNESLLKEIASTLNGRPQYRFIKDHRTLVQHHTQLANKTQLAR